MITYRVVELSIVTDEEIEKKLNELTKDGWYLDGIHFAMRESSKRPSMAFMIFYKFLPDEEKKDDQGGMDKSSF